MTLSTLDPVPALVVVDLQRGITGRDTTPHPVAEVVARSAELADDDRRGARRARRPVSAAVYGDAGGR